MTNIAVILVGGSGKRLGDITKKTPKPLIRINGRPFLDYLISFIAKSKIQSIYLLCSYKSHQFLKLYDKKKFFGKKIYIIKEKKRNGTGGALFYLKKYIKKDFLLFNGDSLINFNIDDFIKFSKRKSFSILCCKNNSYKSNKKLSNLETDQSGKIFFKEKSSFMNAGVYYINKQILNSIENKFISLEDEIIPRLITKNIVYGIKCNSKFLDIGLRKNLKIAGKFLSHNFKENVLFLDRDGVINRDTNYVYKIKNLEILNGVEKAIQFAVQKFYLVICITNQSGIGRGYFKYDDVKILHEYINKRLQKYNAEISEFYVCPHHPVHGKGKFKKKCSCRKPNPGLIKRAIKKYNINLKNSFMIGDKHTDKQAAMSAGIKFYFKEDVNFLKQIKKYL